jgi:hypothetical protein
MAQYAFTFTSGDTVTPTKLNDARTVSEIVDADISNSAAIAGSKLADGAINNAKVATNAAIAKTKIALTDSIVDADINAAAAIDGGKINPAFISQVSISRASGITGNAPELFFNRLRTVATGQEVALGTRLGSIFFSGRDDAGNFIVGARILANVDDEPSTNDMPGRLIFGTTASGASAPTERMRITSAGNVGIGTSAPNAAAQLDVASTARGFLPPRMTTAQRNAISTPPAGLMIYNTSTNKLNVRTASSWEAVTSA